MCVCFLPPSSVLCCIYVSVLQDPELIKRLDQIRRKQEQKEYDQMVKNVDNSVSDHAMNHKWHALGIEKVWIFQDHLQQINNYTVFPRIDHARTIYFSALIGAWTNRGCSLLLWLSTHEYQNSVYTVLAYIRLVLVGVVRGLFEGAYYSAQITQRCEV